MKESKKEITFKTMNLMSHATKISEKESEPLENFESHVGFKTFVDLHFY